MIEIQLAKEVDLKQLAYIEEVCFPVKEAATLFNFKKIPSFPRMFFGCNSRGKNCWFYQWGYDC